MSKSTTQVNCLSNIKESTEKNTRQTYFDIFNNLVNNKQEREIRIHEWLSQKQIEKIKEQFEHTPGNVLTYDELYDLYINIGIQLTQDEYKLLFLKINQSRQNLISWNEFCDFLIYLFQQDDPFNQKEQLSLPISNQPIEKGFKHKTPIISISILESLVTKEELDTNVNETYVTASKDGQINFWSADLELTKKGISKSQYLKVNATWVLCVVALSDCRVICVSTTERELRFYDIIATNFNLRLIIRNVRWAICTMYYSFCPNGEQHSRLIMGDLGGNVNVLTFSPHSRGTFENKTGKILFEFTWLEILKGRFTSLKAKEYKKVFLENVQQVYYTQKFDTYYAAAEIHKIGSSCEHGGVIAIDKRDSKLIFDIPLGVTAFALDEKTRILVTGGPDTFLRLWDIFINKKALAVLSGHYSCICYIFIQPEEKKIYSIDVSKVIKVWNILDRNLLQTFVDLVHITGLPPNLTYMYNRSERKLLIGGTKFISLECSAKIKLSLTDGNTHVGSVSVVLFNKLYKNIVTCGFDSNIIVWNPWKGKRELILKKCHSVKRYGDIIDIPITAACFGCPLQQLLLTGARDGSLKIWNYNMGICIRNMHIDKDCEVTSVIWIPDRILVCGWNHIITEFPDVEGQEFFSESKKWVKLHDDDITAAAYKPNEILVTGTYSGEILLWMINTAHPYRKYLVEKPAEFVKIVLGKTSETKSVARITKPKKAIEATLLSRKSISYQISEKFRDLKQKFNSQIDDEDLEFTTFNKSLPINEYQTSIQSILPLDLSEDMLKTYAADHSYKKYSTAIESIGFGQRLTGSSNRTVFNKNERIMQLKLSVQDIIILRTRPQSRTHGSIFVALENGYIQIYSSHQLGGYIKEFNAVHKTGDCVMCMTTDQKDRYLFTGTAFGYVKIWFLQNYCIPKAEKQKICMPLLRLQFIFMRHDRILGRAKRVIRHQPEPILLNSYKAHIRSITSIEYIENIKILVTGSHDSSCRLWTLGGRYLGTLGSLIPWEEISSTQEIDEKRYFRIPPDIKKIASSTTLKVLTGEYVDRLEQLIQKDTKMENINITSKMKTFPFNKNFGKPLTEPLLGKHFKLEIDGKVFQAPILDSSLPHIPVWEHLEISETVDIERPPTPEILKKTKELDFMDYYNTDQKKSDN